MLILRRLYSRQSSSARYTKPVKADPGISKQKTIFTETQDVSEVDFEELESDFMSVHSTHREHVRQMEAWREKEKYLIVKRKYFKEKSPNFLMWHDKEQIRYLHDRDPEEWNIEKLSESFPALPEVIEKIIKNKWTKPSQIKVAAHDRSVVQHWTDFKQGKFSSLPKELKDHLKMFTDRSLILKPLELPNGKEKKIKTITKNEITGEFSEIIASYQRLQTKNTNENEKQDVDVKYFNNESGSSEKDILDIKPFEKDGKLLTFKELQRKVQKDIIRGKDVSDQEKLILKETPLPISNDLNTTIVLNPEEISNIIEQRHKTTTDKVGFVKKTARDMSHLVYPEQISIPKKHYKKGYTYKLNDCYYDCDGEFLYRVPGMS